MLTLGRFEALEQRAGFCGGEHVHREKDPVAPVTIDLFHRQSLAHAAPLAIFTYKRYFHI
jgi:hypothetical protein